MVASKLGLGLLAGYDPNDLNAARAGGLNVMLLQEHADQLPKTIELCPYPSIRSFHKDSDGGPYQLGQKSDGWMEHGLKHMQFKANAELAAEAGKRLWVAGPNETHNHMAEFGHFEADRAVLLFDIDARAIVGNFGVGIPTPENMLAFWMAFYIRLKELDRTDIEFGAGWHEYGYIWPWTWLGDFQGENINPEKGIWLPPVPKPGELGWLIGRFQIFYQIVPDVLAELELPAELIDLVSHHMTECGLDIVKSDKWDLPQRQLKDETEEPFGGWRTCANYWKKYYPDTGFAKMYGKILQWIDRYYSQFEDVVVIDVFGDGPHHPNDDWPEGQFIDYDIGGTKHVIPMMIESKPPAPIPDPTPDPDPPPDPEPTPDLPEPNPDPDWWLATPAVWEAFFALIRVAIKAAGRNPDPVMAAIWAALE